MKREFFWTSAGMLNVTQVEVDGEDSLLRFAKDVCGAENIIDLSSSSIEDLVSRLHSKAIEDIDARNRCGILGVKTTQIGPLFDDIEPLDTLFS